MPVVDRAERAERGPAAAAAGGEERALRLDRRRASPGRRAARRGGRVIGIVGPALDGERALAGRGRQDVGRDRLGDPAGEAQAGQPGDGQHERVRLPVGQAAQAGVDVPVERVRPKVGPSRKQEGDAARAVGADPGADWQGVQRQARIRRDEGVAGVFAGREGGDPEPIIARRRDVLGAVHRDVDPPIEEGGLQGGDEGAFAPDGVGGTRVAGRPDGDDLDVRTELPGAPRRSSPTGRARARCRGFPGANGARGRCRSQPEQVPGGSLERALLVGVERIQGRVQTGPRSGDGSSARRPLALRDRGPGAGGAATPARLGGSAPPTTRRPG